MSYCDLCQGIIPWFVNGFKDMSFMSRYASCDDIEYIHHPVLAELANASQSGCQLCHMLFRILSNSQVEARNVLEKQDANKPFILRFVNDDIPKLTYEGSCPGFSVDLQFYSLPSPFIVPIVSTLSDHLAAHPLTTIVQHYIPFINRCAREHPICNIESLPGYLPRILICVGPKDGSIEPFLIESKDIRKRDENGEIGPESYDTRHARYVTLSHYWGVGPHFSNTVKANLEARKKELPTSGIKQSFQDAIKVTRHLNLQYLWIDSLYIVQDDPEDWESQSSVMSFVYNNALVNLAITSASDGSEGFLHDRITPCELPLSTVSSPHLKRTNLWIRPISPPEHGIVESRAWIVQELTLAPRTISFGQHETGFRCRTLELRESDFLSESDNWSCGRANEYYKQYFDFIDIVQDMDNASLFTPATGGIWHRMVEIYSEKQLSNHTDKLAAISGLALHFVAKMRDKKYAAGIWRADLPAGLCWHVRQEASHGKYEEYVAPSWSWASQRGPITYLSQASGNDCQIIRSEVEVTDARVGLSGNQTYNVLGRVESGFLRIKGKVLEGILLRKNKNGAYEMLKRRVWQSDKMLGGNLITDDVNFDAQRESWCLLLGQNERNSGRERCSETTQLSSMGLLLQRFGDGDFQRVGLFLGMENLKIWNSAKEMIITIY